MRTVTKICKQCDSEFKMLYKNRNTARKFCSISCGAKHSRAEMYAGSRLSINCATCAKEFSTNKYAVEVAKKRFCSKACADKSKIIPIPTFDCGHCGKQSFRTRFTKINGGYNYSQKYCSKVCADDSQRKGWMSDKNGYRYRTLNGKQIFEHREVMEKIIGRPLTSEETVHHKNGDRAFNDPSNLELWSKNHGAGQRVEDKIAWCVSFLQKYPMFLAKQGFSLIEKTENDVISMSEYVSGLMSNVG